MNTLTPDEDGFYTSTTTLSQDVGSVVLYTKGLTCTLLTFILKIEEVVA